MMSSQIEEIFYRLWLCLEPYKLLIQNYKGLISFSGGKDSIVLYYFFKYLFDKNLIPQPVLFYMNHRIRNNQNEIAGIRDFLASTGWEYIYKEKDIPKISKKIGKSLEETGRLLRYKYLNQCRNELNRKNPNLQIYISTGHHSVDYMESIFIHWFRGGGESALKTLSTWDGMILRPLVLLEDKELYNLYSVYRQEAFEDESNYDEKYLRNRIRKNLIPYLQKEGLNFKKLHSNFHEDLPFCPVNNFQNQTTAIDYIAITANILKLINSQAEWKRFLDIHLRLLKLHPARRSTVQETYSKISLDSTSSYSTKEFYIYFHWRNGCLIFRKDSSLFRSPRFKYHDSKIIYVYWGEKSIHFDPHKICKKIGIVCNSILDCTISPPIPGERILNSGIHKEVSELLRIHGIPPILRKNFPILRINNIPIKILFELFDPYNRI